ncbi:MAG: protein kinase [Planctomycetota bacterium]
MSPDAEGSFGETRAPSDGETLALTSGSMVGPYRLERPLGQGGQGVVWLADEVRLGRQVALKLLRPGHESARTLALFEREARAGARLAHPGIVTVYASGVERGVAWIAQELVPGGRTLRDRIDEVRNAPAAPQAWYTEVAELGLAIAEALAVAHDADVIHRDVKPHNVLLTPEGRTKVTDFGLARLGDASALTRTGEIQGTYLYMSPEQVRAHHSAIDERTDVFSLGVVLYELLTLQRPFDGDTAHQVCQRIVEFEPVSPNALRSRIPRDLSTICQKAIEKTPGRRYQSMTAFADDIRRYLRDEPIEASPPSVSRRVGRWIRKHPVRTTASTLTLLALGVVSTLLVQLDRKSGDLLASNVALAGERDRLLGFREFLKEMTRQTPARMNSDSPLSFVSMTAASVNELEQNPDLDPQLQGMLREFFGMTYARLGRFEGAKRELQLAHQLLPDDASVARNLVFALKELGDYEGADATAKEFLERPAEDSLERRHIAMDRVESLVHLGRLDEAEEQLEEHAPRNEPALERAAANLSATIAYARGDLAQHLEHRRRAYELALVNFRENGRTKQNETDNFATALMELAQIRHREGSHDEARALWTEADDLNRQVLADMVESLGEDHLHTSYAQNNRAALLLDLERPDEALPLIERVLETRLSDPTTSPKLVLTGFFNLCRHAKMTGDADLAEERLDEGIGWFEARPDEGDVQMGRRFLASYWVDLLVTLGRFDDAVAIAEALGALEAEPEPFENDPAAFGLFLDSARAYLETGDRERAREILTALASPPAESVVAARYAELLQSVR